MKIAKKRTEQQLHSRIPAFDILRIIACILVVLIHVSAQWTDASASKGTAALAFSLGCNMLAFASLPIFIMISGALYLPSRGADTRRMFRRSVHFVALYFIWKLFYLLEDCVMEPELLAREGFKKHVILALFQTEGKYHLWYLPMLAVLLFLTPLICDGLQKKTVRRMYLIPFFILAVLLPTAFQFEFPFKYLLMDFRNLFDLSYFIGYLGFYILGYHLWCTCSESGGDGSSLADLMKNSRHTKEAGTSQNEAISKNKLAAFNRTGVVCLSAAIPTWIIGLIHAVRRTLSSGETFYGLSTPFALHSLLLAAAIFLLMISKKPSDTIMNRTAAGLPLEQQKEVRSSSPESTITTVPSHSSQVRLVLSTSTFGIYLVHPFVLDLLTKSGFLSILHSPFYGIPVLLAVVFLLSFLLTEILLHIPLLKKLVK